MEQVVQVGSRFRVQLPSGEFTRGNFHTQEQAEEARLRIVAARVLRIVTPSTDPRRHERW